VTLTATDVGFGSIAGVPVSMNVTIEVIPVNQAPAIAIQDAIVTFDEELHAGVDLFTGIILSDADDASTTSAVIEIQGGMSGDVLVFTGDIAPTAMMISSDG